jgi:hypothetical protein
LQIKGFEIVPEIALALEHDPPALAAEAEDDAAIKNRGAKHTESNTLRYLPIGAMLIPTSLKLIYRQLAR